MIIRVLCLVLTLALIGCDRQGDAWEEAQQQDTIEAYEAYVESYPDSPEAERARARIASLRAEQAWTETLQRNTAEAYRAYIEAHPDAETADEARDRLATLEREAEWQKLADSDDIAELRAFAADHSDTPEAELARQRISELEARAEAERRERERERQLEQERQAQREAEQRTHRVQLAAVSGQEQANRSIELLEQRLGDVLGDVGLEAQRANGLYVLVTRPMRRERADALCDSLKQRGQDCLVRER